MGMRPSPMNRPVTVTAGVACLIGTVALCLAEVAVGIVGVVGQRNSSLQNYGSGSSDYLALTAVMIILVAVNVMVAIGLSAAALLSLRGRSSGRWVALGTAIPAVLLHCGCGGLSGAGLYGSQHGDVNPFPNWLFTVSMVIDTMTLVVVIVGVLLLVGPSRRYFLANR